MEKAKAIEKNFQILKFSFGTKRQNGFNVAFKQIYPLYPLLFAFLQKWLERNQWRRTRKHYEVSKSHEIEKEKIWIY